MRRFVVVLCCLTVSALTGACGQAAKPSAPARSSDVKGQKPVLPVLNEQGTSRYLNDGDHDGTGEDNGRYHDSDDPGLVFVDRVAPPAVRRAVTALVERYYSLAVSGDARKACSLLAPGLAKALPLQYGRLGPSYLRGAKTCEAILSIVFARQHRELTAPVAVTDVFVKGDEAFILLGSTKMRASWIDPIRRHGRWWLDEMLGTPFA